MKRGAQEELINENLILKKSKTTASLNEDLYKAAKKGDTARVTS